MPVAIHGLVAETDCLSEAMDEEIVKGAYDKANAPRGLKRAASGLPGARPHRPDAMPHPPDRCTGQATAGSFVWLGRTGSLVSGMRHCPTGSR